MRVKEIDHKEFVSSCCDDRINYLIRKVTGINWLVLHLHLTHTSASLFFTTLPFFSPSLLELVCFDSALYLYFKWLNYTGSCSENYGCFLLFLSAGTWWPLQGSNKPPPPFPIHLFLSTCVFFLLSHCRPHFFPLIYILLPFRDWQEIIAKWSCLCTLGTASWQKVFSW